MLHGPSSSATDGGNGTPVKSVDRSDRPPASHSKRRSDGVVGPAAPESKLKKVKDGAGDETPCVCDVKAASPASPQRRSFPSREELANAIRHKLQRYRYWNPTELGRQLANPAMRRKGDLAFSLMSYNILAQGLLEGNDFLYSHCRPDVLIWDHRKKNLLEEMSKADADIMCLQELQEDHYEEVFKPQLESKGYSCIYKRRTGNKQDGCGIFFRNSVFELDRYEAVEFARAGISVLDRDNVGLVALLKPKDFDRCDPDFRLCVSTTHLLFNPRRGDIKLAQLCLLLAEIDRMAFRGVGAENRPSYFPVILCGDMNSEPHSPLYSFVTHGALHYAGLLSGDISGQSDGANRGRTVPLEDCLHQLDISDNSQYRSVCAERMKHCGSSDEAECGTARRRDADAKEEAMDCGQEDAPATERADEVVTACGKPEQQNGRADEQEPRTETEITGSVQHGLNLVSAYRHVKRGSVPEVTTHHQKASCTVDYIFYSVLKKKSLMRDFRVVQTDVVEGPLRLLGTYGLMSAKELENIHGLPNEVQSSDHLALVARFLLRVTR